MSYFEWFDLIEGLLLKMGFTEEQIMSLPFTEFWDNGLQWWEVIDEAVDYV